MNITRAFGFPVRRSFLSLSLSLGLVAAAVATFGAARPAAATGMEIVEVSAPILPRVSVLYAAEGNSFRGQLDRAAPSAPGGTDVLDDARPVR